MDDGLMGVDVELVERYRIVMHGSAFVGGWSGHKWQYWDLSELVATLRKRDVRDDAPAFWKGYDARERARVESLYHPVAPTHEPAILAVHRELTERAAGLMRRKNHDYTNAASEADGDFHNFTQCEKLGICDTTTGILTRMTDKLARLVTLTKREAQVEDESLEDTVLDLINYSVIIAAYRRHVAGLCDAK